MTAKTSAEYMREWIARPGNREKKQAMNRKYYERIKADGKMTRDNMERNRFRKHGTTRAPYPLSHISPARRAPHGS